jgi:hypothetical protein
VLRTEAMSGGDFRIAGWLLLAGLLTSVPGPAQPAPELFRLQLDEAQFVEAPIRVAAEDLVIELADGAGFVAEASGRPTGLVLVGNGRLRFSPPLRSEQRQLVLMAGSSVLSESFDAAFLRFHPADFKSLVVSGKLLPGAGPRESRRLAEAVFREEVGRSFSLKPESTGKSPLSALPPRGDLLAELRTRRFGWLDYARVGADPEDILFFDRGHGRTIASYPSRAHGSASGLAYGDEWGLRYEAQAYYIELDIDPNGRRISGRARVSLKALEPLETVSLRLDRGLTVSAVRSASGPHQFLQRKDSDTLLVRVLPPLAAGSEISLEVSFAGFAKTQDISRPIDRDGCSSRPGGEPCSTPRSPSSGEFLLWSNRVYFFPQSPARNHALATLRVRLPEGYAAIAPGIPESQAGRPSEGFREFVFHAEQPVRYLSLLVGRLSSVEVPAGLAPIPLQVFSAPALSGRAHSLPPQIADILSFYSSLAGPDPYPSLTAALVPAAVAAGHSPAYLCLLAEPPGWNPARAGDNAAYFDGEPSFGLAHELAHQWWGQGVGWRNYREQWLSEGLAQYFAALYVRKLRGEGAFERVLAWMKRWALSAAGKGPVSLGMRVGEITGCETCFAAALYDRGALTLHMLRGLLGEETFWRGLRLYLERWKFRRASTDDLEHIFEEVSGRDLSRFFEQWVREDGVPKIEWSAKPVESAGARKLSLRLTQVGEPYELPLSVSIESGGESRTEVVRIRLPVEEFQFELAGPLRRVAVNADHAALCEAKQRPASGSSLGYLPKGRSSAKRLTWAKNLFRASASGDRSSMATWKAWSASNPSLDACAVSHGTDSGLGSRLSSRRRTSSARSQTAEFCIAGNK